MEDKQDLLGTLDVSPHNSFYVKYKLYQKDNKDISATIQPSFVDNSEKDFSIIVSRNEDKDVSSTLDVKYKAHSEVVATLQPVSSKFVDSTINVNPHNSMYAIVDILQPPLLTKEFTITKDATTRNGIAYQTLNYGTEPTMMTGYKNGEEFESYISFDFQLPQQMLIQNASLKFYFVGNFPNDLNIKLYSVDREWSEYGLTYKNKPQRLELVSESYTVNYSDRSINFDLKNEINALYSNQKTTKGYVLVVEDNNSDKYISFYTKESLTPPKLIIDYYDTQIFSAGRAQVNSTLFVYGGGIEEIGATLNVYSDRGNHDLPSTLYIHKYDVPVSKDLSMSITVSRNEVNSSLTVSHRDKNEAMMTVTVAEKLINDLISTLNVTRTEVNSTFYVKYQDTIDASITVQKYETQDIKSTIAVNRNSIDSSIFVKEKSYLNSSITVQKNEGSDIFSTIMVTRECIPAAIIIKERNYLNSTITVQRHEDSSVLSTITVIRESVPATITVKDRNDINATMFIYQNDKSEITSILDVKRDYINGTIMVNTPSDVDSTMIISKPEIKAEIAIRVEDENNLNTVINIRAKNANDLYSTLLVNRKINGAYYYII